VPTKSGRPRWDWRVERDFYLTRERQKFSPEAFGRPSTSTYRYPPTSSASSHPPRHMTDLPFPHHTHTHTHIHTHARPLLL